MKKIISLITIVLMMLCGIIACETEQGSSEEETTTTVKKEGDKKDTTTTSTTVKGGNNQQGGDTTTSTTIAAGTVFSLTLDNQGANTAGSAKIYLKYGVGYYLDKNCKKEITDETGAITLPAKTGFSFLGYNADKAGKGQAVITAEGLLDLDAGYSDFKADTTLYAQWEKVSAHNIYYYNIKDATNDNPATFSESEDITLKNLSLKGYTFGGWWTKAEGGERISSWVAGSKTADVTLYARWTAITYTVTFNANGGTGSMQPQTFTYDVSQDLTSFALTAPEYKKFQNWNTKSDGTGTSYNNGQNVKNLTDKAETIILYAQWMDKDAHRINYHNIKTANNSNNVATFKESQNVALFNLSLNGWTFDGWYDESEDGTKIEGWGAGTKTADVDVWAYWTPLVYQLTYKDEGDNNLTGTLTDPPTTHTYGTDTPLVSPTKKYYDFLGWHKQSNCADNSIDTIGAETILSDTTLYAKWALHNYKIIYHNIYDAENTNQQTFTINDSVTLSNITATGRTFGGWWTAENSGSQVTSWSAGAKKQDVDVWARWTPKTYSITYKDMNDESFSGEHGANYPMTHTYATATSLVSPTRVGWTFIGWYDTAECDGAKLTSLGAEDYADNITLYAKWELGYGCSAAELSSLLSKLSSANNPYKIIITDEDPDLSLIKSALQSNSIIEVNLDFSRCSDLLSISDLQNCTNLVGITIPDCVLSISESAFSGSSGLTSVTIEANVDCSNVGLYFIKDNFRYKVLNKNSVEVVSNSYSGYVVIPDTVTAGNTFAVTSISDEAFKNCSGLTSITIPNSVTIIGCGAFSGCSGLTSITIPFVGLSATVTGNDANFYRIFGSYSSNVPTSLKTVIITGGTSIGNYAFRDCSGLTSVTMPNSVTIIGYEAFYNCRGLTSISIPDNVTSIGSSAFRGCSGLTSMTMPNSVTSIGQSVFEGCSGLTSISVDESNTVYDSRNNCNAIIETASNTLINGCKNTVIPNSVTSIGEKAFISCSGLTSMTMPNSVTSIGSSAFRGCSGLTSVTIPNSVISIGWYAFSDCNSLTNIEIESNANVSNASLHFRKDNILYQVLNKNSITIVGIYDLSDVVIPATVTVGNTFAVTSIDTSFKNCSSISVDAENTIYDSRNNCNAIIQTASNKLIRGCKNTVIPDSVTSIGSGAFSGCSGLTSIEIPNSVTSIADDAFAGCSGLTSVIIPNSVTSIGDSSFYSCSSLNSVVIPESVTSISNRAFSGCSGLTSVEIPNSVTWIGMAAFNGCSGLTSVSIPDRVGYIFKNAFYNCNNLTTLTVKATTPPSLDSGTFYNCSALTTIYVPTGSVEAYKTKWSTYADKIVGKDF